MENKEKIKFMNYLKCCMEDCDMNKTYENPKTDYQKINEIIKDLEEKELLESELKLEKDKVKYVMKQLKKQDKILEILKRTKIDLWDFEQDIVYFDEELYGRTAYEWYSMHYREFSLEKLTQEHFNLIVGWLRNGNKKENLGNISSI